MRMRCVAVGAAVLIAAFATVLGARSAQAHLTISIDKSTQRMTVSVDGVPHYVWPVSTGVAKYDTPDGSFRPFRMEKDHFSKEWDDAPMPYSIFFTKQGHAIHGTNHTSIGRPASHGCVRLSVKHAAILWGLVKQEKMANTTVVLHGQLPDAGPPAVAQLPDADATGALPPREAENWREYNNGPRYYYYRDDGPTYYQVQPGYPDRRQRTIVRRNYYYDQPPPPPPPPHFLWFGR